MALCTRLFTYIDSAVNTASRSSGWQLQDTPDFDPMSIAYTVVHDAVEHHKPGESGIENEMMAFGSLYHIRVLGGWWNQWNLPADPVMMIAWDMARFLAERNFEIAPPPRVASRVLDPMLKNALGFYQERLARYHHIDKYHPDYVKALYAFRDAAGWLSVGYTRSLKRWHGNAPSNLTNLFISLTKMIEGVNEKRHGDRLKVCFNTQNLNHAVYHTCIN